jgi:hypothetical protein
MIFILKKRKYKTNFLIKSIDVFLVNHYLQTKCNLTVPKENYSFAFYVYHKNKREPVFRSNYSEFDTNQVKLNENGEYRVKVFVKNNETKEIKTLMSSPIQKSTVIDF